MSICLNLSIALDSVGPGLRSSTPEAGTQLRYLPLMGVIVRGLSATRKDHSRVGTLKGIRHRYDIRRFSFGSKPVRGFTGGLI